MVDTQPSILTNERSADKVRDESSAADDKLTVRWKLNIRARTWHYPVPECHTLEYNFNCALLNDAFVVKNKVKNNNCSIKFEINLESNPVKFQKPQSCFEVLELTYCAVNWFPASSPPLTFCFASVWQHVD